MFKKTLTATTFSTLVLLIISCSKENSIVFPQVYESASINDVNLRVFTKNGEITNQVNTEKLLEPFNWLFTDIENSTIKGEIIVTYNSLYEVAIQEINTTDTDYRDVTDVSGISYWEKRDTTYTRSSLSEFEKFFTYHPIYQEEKKIQTLNETHTTYKPCFYAKHENGKLLLPMLDFAVFDYNNWFPKSGVKKYKNVFDDATFSKLGVNDTLVVQSYSIEFLPQ